MGDGWALREKRCFYYRGKMAFEAGNVGRCGVRREEVWDCEGLCGIGLFFCGIWGNGYCYMVLYSVLIG